MSQPAEERLSVMLAGLEDGFARESGEELRYPHSCAVLSATGQLIAQRLTAPILSFVLPDVARRLVEHGAAPALQGDEVLVSNDPYMGGVSLNTISVLAPITDGVSAPSVLVGFAVRYPDIGAMSPQAYSLKREITHEGFRLSLVRFAARDSRLPELLTAMMSANVREPDKLIGGLRAQVATTRELAARLAADKGSGIPSGARASPPGDGRGTARFKRGCFRGMGLLPSSTGVVSVPKVAAEVDVQGTTVVVHLSMVGERLAADCNSPVGATRAAVLTALGEACGTPPWVIEPLVRIETGGHPQFNATYPAAVGGGARVAYGCYLAVAAALREAGATQVGGRSFHEFSGEDSL